MKIIKLPKPFQFGGVFVFARVFCLRARAWTNSEGLGPCDNVFRLRSRGLKIQISLPAARLETCENEMVSNMFSVFKPEGTFVKCNSGRFLKKTSRRFWAYVVCSKTLQNNLFSGPRTRPDRVRFGPRERQVVRRPPRRSRRFGSFL